MPHPRPLIDAAIERIYLAIQGRIVDMNFVRIDPHDWTICFVHFLDLVDVFSTLNDIVVELHPKYTQSLTLYAHEMIDNITYHIVNVANV